LKVKVQPRPQTIAQARAELSRRLEARRDEIEAAVMNRVYSVSDTKDLDPTYAEGLKAAVTAAVDYGLIAIELGEERSEPPPPILLAQARLAARAGVSLDTVLRRYFAGHALLGDFLVEEAEESGLRGNGLQRLLRTQAALFDRLLAAVSEEHAREAEGRLGTQEERRAERIERLLDGELVDASELDYDLEGTHLGLIAKGPRVHEAVHRLSRHLDRRLLSVRPEEGVLWAWLGGHRRLDSEDLDCVLSKVWPQQAMLVVGEPGEGVRGWRLSHRQAAATLPVALRGAEPVVRYRDVALLASVIQDELLTTSLQKLYLVPLEAERDGGYKARETLQAYFAARGNIASAAAGLGISRQATGNRLRRIEQLLDRSLESCQRELELALRLSVLTS
jgi:hypothetical protein